MFDYYDLDIIPIMLNRFKVTDIIISGMLDEQTMGHILNYSEVNNASCVSLDSGTNSNMGSVLKHLSEFKDYGAIFLNDDPNWFTIYNELKTIKENNKEFPLVFICNNIFPHKRRDSYTNPECIPKEFINEYSKKLILDDVSIQDGFCHAINENTSKNGVLTAIEDFLVENKSIGLMNIKLLNGITILYPNNSISQIRLSRLIEEIEGHNLEFDSVSDYIIENQILINHILSFKLSNSDFDIINDFKDELQDKEKIIEGYENKVKLQNDELSYRDSKINGTNLKLNIKDSEIKNVKSKLVNRENEINNLNDKLKYADMDILSLKNELNRTEDNFKNKEINYANQINALKNTISFREKEINDNELMLNSIKQQYIKQLSKLDNNEYCISCFKEEISSNHHEIRYLKKNNFTRKFFSPFSYIYLIIRSIPNDLFLNYKLYRALKSSKCFDIGFYLVNNEDIQESIWCKFFSPELHYVCHGFEEKRKFNKKYFNTNSKKALLDYILNCNK